MTNGIDISISEIMKSLLVSLAWIVITIVVNILYPETIQLRYTSAIIAVMIIFWPIWSNILIAKSPIFRNLLLIISLIGLSFFGIVSFLFVTTQLGAFFLLITCASAIAVIALQGEIVRRGKPKIVRQWPNYSTKCTCGKRISRVTASFHTLQGVGYCSKCKTLSLEAYKEK